MSLGVFFLILKYAFQETEQRLLLAVARSARRTRQRQINSKCNYFCFKTLILRLPFISIKKIMYFYLM